MMQFHSLADFFAMGGYAFYVWSAYGISLLLVAGYFVGLRRRQHSLESRIRRLLQRETDERELGS